MVVTKVLVKWKHELSEYATWEFYYELKRKYPSLEDKNVVKEGHCYIINRS